MCRAAAPSCVRGPHVEMMGGRVAPSAAITLAAVIGAIVRHRPLNRHTDAEHVAGEMIRVQRCLHRHHAATDVRAYRSGDDRALSRNHTAHCRTDAQCTSGIAATHL